MSDKLQGGIKAGSIDFSSAVVLRKTADNTEMTGKAAADMTLSYWRQGGSRTAVSASDLAAVDSAHGDGGVKEADATNMPGAYRVDWPDAAFATGADWVVLTVKVASAYVFHERYSLTTNAAQTGDSYARLGAPAGASVSADVAAVKGDTAAILVDTGTTLEAHLTDIKGTDFVKDTDSLVNLFHQAAWVQPDNDSIALILEDTGTTLPAAVLLCLQAADYEAGPDTTAIVSAIDAQSTVLANINGRTQYLPAATAGEAGGVFIAGANAATTFASLAVTSGFTINGVATSAQSGDAYARIGANGAGLTTLATAGNQTDILGRIGPFSGSGLNTILGFLRASLRKDAALTPSDVGGTFDNTTDSQEAFADNGVPTGAAGGLTAEEHGWLEHLTQAGH